MRKTKKSNTLRKYHTHTRKKNRNNKNKRRIKRKILTRRKRTHVNVNNIVKRNNYIQTGGEIMPNYPGSAGNYVIMMVGDSSMQNKLSLDSAFN